MKNLAIQGAVFVQEKRRQFQNSPHQAERLLVVGILAARGPRRHVAEHHMKPRPVFFQILDDFVGKNIITEPMDFGMGFLKGNAGRLQIDTDHRTGLSRSLSRIETPTAGVATEVENPLTTFEESVFLLRLLQFVHRTGRILLFLGLLEIVILFLAHLTPYSSM